MSNFHVQDVIEKHMEVTERLTKELNSKGLKSYLEVDNMVLGKLQQERQDLKDFLVCFGLNRWKVTIQESYPLILDNKQTSFAKSFVRSNHCKIPRY